MPDGDDDLTEEQKQLYRKTRVPHKFCPNCGTRNQPDADVCSTCNKDISWMRVPEPIPYDEGPKQPPRSLPEQQKVFTLKTVIVMALILGLIFAFILVLLLVTRGKTAELAPAALAAAAFLCSVEGSLGLKGSRSRGLSALSRTSSRCARCSKATSHHRRA